MDNGIYDIVEAFYTSKQNFNKIYKLVEDTDSE